MMGAVGGLLGALFNSINTQITIYRLKYLIRRKRLWRSVVYVLLYIYLVSCSLILYRVLEAVLIVMCTTAAVSIATMLLGTCVPVVNENNRANYDPSVHNFIYQPVSVYVRK